MDNDKVRLIEELRDELEKCIDDIRDYTWKRWRMMDEKLRIKQLEIEKGIDEMLINSEVK